MKIHISSLDDLGRAAQRFITAMGHHRIFAFHGPMGAGKTTFITAVCRALGSDDTVNSPTFAIVNEYADGESQPIYHFDFYRIRRPEEAMDIGLDDYLYSGHLCLIEWPEVIECLLPDDTVHVSIEEQNDGTRTLTL